MTEVESGDELTLELRVAPEDMGKVIGRQGRVAKEIPHGRALLCPAHRRQGIRGYREVLIRGTFLEGLTLAIRN